MTITLVGRFDGKRLEVCDHQGTMRQEARALVCDECGCRWSVGVGWVTFSAHMRIQPDDGR